MHRAPDQTRSVGGRFAETEKPSSFMTGRKGDCTCSGSTCSERAERSATPSGAFGHFPRYAGIPGRIREIVRMEKRSC